MSWYWILAGVVVVAVGAMLYYTNALRYAKSVVLIAGVSPYEQVGTGEGRILVLGDSTGYGTGVKDAKESIAGRIGADYPGYAIVNKSVNGDTIEKAIARIGEIEGEFDLILLQLGANDIIQKRPLENSLADSKMLVEQLRPLTSKIVMMSAGNVGGAPAFAGAEEAEYEQLSRDFHQAFTDYADTEPDFFYVHFFAEPEVDPFVIDPATYMAIDGLHPSGAGYGLWYEKLKPVVDMALQNGG